MPGLKIYDFITNTVQTTGGSSATILTSTPPNSINTIATLEIIARCQATDDRAYWYRIGYVNKNSAGVLTVDKQADVIPQFSTNPIKKADIDVQISGGTVNIVVTGDPGFAAQPLEWQALCIFWRT